jgi:precorrin-2 dehydrogenase/sirohydrochlorin ferrochelatase
MKYYPVFLALSGKKAVIVGGGRVAERKAAAMIKAGAFVEVVSPAITKVLGDYRKKGLIRHKRKKYKKADLKDAFIVIAASSSKEINSKVNMDARQLVNVVDTPSEGNFITPSIVRRGPLTIAISTEGCSPAVSKAIRKEIQSLYGPEFSQYLRFAGKVRQEAMSGIKDPRERERFLKRLASGDILDTLRHKGLKSVLEKYSLKPGGGRVREPS